MMVSKAPWTERDYMPAIPPEASEISILNRLLRPESPTFSPEGA
jgi:hypothetical protein